MIINIFLKNPHIKIFLKKSLIHPNKFIFKYFIQNEPKKEGEKTSENTQDDETTGLWLNNIN